MGIQMKRQEPIDEEDILRRCRSGEREAFAVLVDRYGSMAYTVAYRLVGDADAANDLAQEGFIAAYQNLRQFRAGSRFSTWLCSIVLNRCRDHLRAAKRMTALDAVPDLRANYGKDPAEAASTEETHSSLQRALDELPPEYREVLVLKHIEGRSYAELSEMLGMPVGALKVRAHRGRALLRDILERAGVAP